uniref:Uncharacterized protein n=1 Tax=Panagrolaimus sp. JU765 TaxID=591449 RepID=A0AC34QMD5_9BILA
MVACYEGDYDRRQHLLALNELQMNTDEGTFKGLTGIVNIDANGSRDASFWFTGMMPDLTARVFMTMPFTKGELTTYVNFTDPATTIWALRQGKAPLAVPLCGFDGNSCPVNFWESYAAYAFSALALGIIVIALVIAYGL